MSNSAPKSFFNPPFKTIQEIEGLKITVMGLGLNGGGLASARFFAEHGAIVTVTDTKTEEELSASIKKLEDLKIKYVLGKHDIKDFEEADVVIKNPGVKLLGNEFLAVAKSIETDVSVFLRLTQAPIIAVTGSKGKSSTVSAIHWGLKEAGFNAFLGGNITVSPLSFLEQTSTYTPVVLELSSWQLADLRGRNLLKPKVAVITSIMPDHQNWYGSMEKYVDDKKLIYASQDDSCVTICNGLDSWGLKFASETKAKILFYSSVENVKNVPAEFVGLSTPSGYCDHFMGAFLDSDGVGYINWKVVSKDSSGVASSLLKTEKRMILPCELVVPGKHQKENLLNAAQVLSLFGVSDEKICEILPKFPGIPHRLEFFHEYNGVKFYNDSAATIPEATVAAIQAFDKKPILLCGGTDKVIDFAPLAQAASEAKEIFLLKGTGTEKLIPLLDEKNIKYYGPFETLEELLTEVLKIAKSGDVVVFSPGATSFGMFKNEFDRGTKFKEAVLASCC